MICDAPNDWIVNVLFKHFEPGAEVHGMFLFPGKQVRNIKKLETFKNVGKYMIQVRWYMSCVHKKQIAFVSKSKNLCKIGIIMVFTQI